MTSRTTLALNPIQWSATDDGWLDPALAPPPAELLALVKKAGFDAVMAAVPAGHTVAAYAALLDDAGLRPAPGYFVCRSQGDPADAPAVIEAAAAAAGEHAELGLTDIGLGLPMIKGGPRILRPAQGTEPDVGRLAALTDLLGRAAEAMRAEGVRPALHPHVGTWIETEAETRAVLDALPAEQLGFLPDTGHLSWAGANVAGLVAEYGRRIPFLHVKDARMTVAEQGRAAGQDYQRTVVDGLWTEPGRGDLDLTGIVAALPDDFAGCLMVEVDRPALTDPYESAVASARWMRSAFALDG
ncbi:sugar phosphate isomerase/epimerase family protein [Streptomyces sp. NPDC055400]